MLRVRKDAAVLEFASVVPVGGSPDVAGQSLALPEIESPHMVSGG